MRENVRDGIAAVEQQLAGGQLDSAGREIRRLRGEAGFFQTDLVDETAALEVLAQRVTVAEIERQTAARQQELETAAWDRRTEEIRGLVEAGKYPEAIQLAKRLGAEAQAPEAVKKLALGLAAEAEQRLQKAFEQSRWQTQDNRVRTSPPPAGGPRRKEAS